MKEVPRSPLCSSARSAHPDACQGGPGPPPHAHRDGCPRPTPPRVRRPVFPRPSSSRPLLPSSRDRYQPDKQERTDECAVTGHLTGASSAPMRSRRSGPGRPLGDTKVSGRGVTCKAPLAHLEGGSGRSETSPTAILQGTHSLVGVLYEVRKKKQSKDRPFD